MKCIFNRLLIIILFFWGSNLQAQYTQLHHLTEGTIPVLQQSNSVAVDGTTAVAGNEKEQIAVVYEKKMGIWEKAAILTASDIVNGDIFGNSVSISANTILVGAGKRDSGSVYVFEKPSDGWIDMTQTAKLTSSDEAEGSYFGHSANISANTIVVGAYRDDDRGNSSGSAYVFEKPSNGWIDMTQTAKLTASDAASFDRFGWSVSISANTIVVGAYGDDLSTSTSLTNVGDDSGSAYVFEKPSDGWIDMTQTAKLTASDEEKGDRLGWSVSISDNTIVVGAWGDDDRGSLSGSAYVFEKPSDGWNNMTQTAKLIASDVQEEDRFGGSVSISNHTIVVGAGGRSIGSAYIFEKPNDGWVNMSQSAKLIASDADALASSFFDYSVSISEEEVWLGTTQKGIYTFTKPNDNWINATQNQNIDKIYNFNGGRGKGLSVAIDKTITVVGMPNVKDRAVFIYENDSLIATLNDLDVTTNDYFVLSVDISDNTIVVGAYGDKHRGRYSGSAYVFEKSGDNWIQTAKLIASDSKQYHYFGESVSIFGNTIVVGARGDGDGGSFTGAVYVFEKPSNGWVNMTQTAKLTASDAEERDNFGESVSISANTIVVGARGDGDGESFSGSVYVFEKSSDSWTNMTQTAKLTTSDEEGEYFFKQSVSVNDNTIALGLLVLVNFDGEGGDVLGSTYVFEKLEENWIQTAKLMASDAKKNNYFGESVSISGNTIVVGASGDDKEGRFSGSAYIFEKPSGGWSNMTQTAKLTASDTKQGDAFGSSVSIFENTIAIGAPFDDTSLGVDVGSVYIFNNNVMTSLPTHSTDDEVIVWGSENHLQLQFGNIQITKAKIHVFTVNGRQVLNTQEWQIVRSQQVTISHNLNFNQPYIIKVETPKGVFTKKWVRKVE